MNRILSNIFYTRRWLVVGVWDARRIWRYLREAYVQQRTAIGWLIFYIYLGNNCRILPPLLYTILSRDILQFPILRHLWKHLRTKILYNLVIIRRFDWQRDDYRWSIRIFALPRAALQLSYIRPLTKSTRQGLGSCKPQQLLLLNSLNGITIDFERSRSFVSGADQIVLSYQYVRFVRLSDI